LHAYVNERILDPHLCTDATNVLEQHALLVGPASSIDDAVAAGGPPTHVQNLGIVKKRQVLEAFARQQLHELVNSTAREHIEATLRPEAARRLAADLPSIERLHRERSEKAAQVLQHITKQRRAAFSQLIEDQFAADESLRARINRSLQLLNSARDARILSSQKAATAVIRPALLMVQKI
jgi:hypothetical protein